MSVATQATSSLAPETPEGLGPLLDAIAHLSTAPLTEIAQRLHLATLPYLDSTAEEVG